MSTIQPVNLVCRCGATFSGSYDYAYEHGWREEIARVMPTEPGRTYTGYACGDCTGLWFRRSR